MLDSRAAASDCRRSASVRTPAELEAFIRAEQDDLDSSEDARATGEAAEAIERASGNAELRGDDYYGPVLNRVSRVMAAGHGGQILRIS